jgi:hypothetical protein
MDADIMSKLLAFIFGSLLCTAAQAQQVTHPVGGPAASIMNEITSWNNATGNLLRHGPAKITDSKTGAIGVFGSTLSAASSAASTAQSIYQMTTPAAATIYSTLEGVTILPPGSNSEGVNGIGTFVLNNNPAGAPGLAGNGVGLFSVGIAAVNDAHTWGLNTLLQDSTSPVVSGGTGRELWNELDFNVTSTSTVVRGLVLTGASLAEPTLSLGVEIRPLGVGKRWSAAFVSQNGAAVAGLTLGTQIASAPNSPSQLLMFNWTSSAGTSFNHNIHSEVGDLIIDSTGIPATGNLILKKGGYKTVDNGAPAGLVLGTTGATGSASTSQEILFTWTNSGGAAFTMGLQAGTDGLLHVLTNGGPTTGGIDLPVGAKYSINGVVGVTCSGTPTAAYTSVGGIVTQC